MLVFKENRAYFKANINLYIVKKYKDLCYPRDSLDKSEDARILKKLISTKFMTLDSLTLAFEKMVEIFIKNVIYPKNRVM
jgi:hypothetical protein